MTRGHLFLYVLLITSAHDARLFAQSAASTGNIGGAKLVSINAGEIVVLFRNEQRTYQLTPATKLQVFGSGQIPQLRVGTPLTLRAKASVSDGEFRDWHLLFDPGGEWSSATSTGRRGADGSIKDWELTLKCVLKSHDPLQLFVLPGNSFSTIDDGKLYSVKGMDLNGKLITLKRENAAASSTLGNGKFDADTFEINLGKNPQLIGTDPRVGVMVDKTNPQTAASLRFTRTEPIELPAAISQKSSSKKGK